MTPSQYLMEQNAEALLNDVTVIVPHHRLRLDEDAVANQPLASGGVSNHGVPTAPATIGAASRQEPHALETAGAGPSLGDVDTSAQQPVSSTSRIIFINSGFLKESGKNPASYVIYYEDPDNKSKWNRKLYYSVTKYESTQEARRAMEADIKKIRDGTFVLAKKNISKHQATDEYEKYQGVTWQELKAKPGSGKWKVRANGIERVVSLDEHDGDKTKAWVAAKQLHADIKAYPAQYAAKQRRTAYQSIVPGVDNIKHREYTFWRVRRNRNNQDRLQKLFPFNNGNDAERDKARLDAERFALSHGARPAIRRKAAFAPGLSDVPIITWDSSREAFLVDDGGEPVPYAISEYENDMEAARTAAEDYARQIAQARAAEAEME